MRDAQLRTASLVIAALGGVCAVAFYFAFGSVSPAPSDFGQFLGRFHPLLVHLPIGFVLLIGLFEAVSLLPRARDRVDGAIGLALPVVVLAAVAAFLLGLLLARGGGYPEKLATWHKRLTLAAILGMSAMVAVWTWYATNGDQVRRHAYRAVLGVTLGVLTIGAHFGGSLSRGEGYLGKYAPSFMQRFLGGAAPAPSKPAPVEAGAEPLVFHDVVQPILQARCVECHGADKSKGNLRLDDYAAVMKGGEAGPAVVAGQGMSSGLTARMLLPAENDDHMPPADKAQPTPEEIAVIQFWIDRGATETLRVRDALPSEGAKKSLEAHGGGAAPVGTSMPSAHPADSAVPDASSQPSSSSSAGVSTAPQVANGSGGNVFDDRVEPLFAARCTGCHGASKQKGKLRLDSLEATLAGGKDGAGFVAGSSSQGSVLARVRLPMDSDEHMPPRKEAQLTPNEVELLAWWAEHGASRSAKTSALPQNLSSAPIPTPTAAPVVTSEPVAPPASTGPAIDPATLPASIQLYPQAVKPLLAKKCGLCHEGQTPSGGMAIDDPAVMIEHGAVLPGKPTQSPLLLRALLPANDTDHMPPEEMPQPDRGDLDLLRLWIQKGASEEIAVTPKELSPAAMKSLAALLADTSTGTGDAGSTSSSGSSSSGGPSGSTGQGGAGSSGSGSTSSGSSASGGSGEPPGAVHGAGCASCTLGESEGSGWLAFGVSAVLVTAFGARRRDRRRS